MLKNLLQVRSFGVNFYVLRDCNGLYLIDCGFIGGLQFLKYALLREGWHGIPVLGILLTHGHLDHILNVSRISGDFGAWIAAPRLDLAHYRGKAVYKGTARVTGVLEAVGRSVLSFSPFTPTRLLDDGDYLDIWGGLTTIHLPGHTAGHSGFYSQKFNLLFSGDLFASYGHFSHFPPNFLNTDGYKIIPSTSRALGLDLSGVLPNHSDRASPEMHLQRLRLLHNTYKQ